MVYVDQIIWKRSNINSVEITLTDSSSWIICTKLSNTGVRFLKRF